jgi:hypothetical protein
MPVCATFSSRAATVLEGVARNLREGKFDRLMSKVETGIEGLRVDWNPGGDVEVLVSFTPKKSDAVPCFIEKPSPVVGDVIDALRPISYSRCAISSEDVIDKVMECFDCGKRIVVPILAGPEISRVSCEACVRKCDDD